MKTVLKVMVRLAAILSKGKWKQTLFKGKDLILNTHSVFLFFVKA